MKTTALFKSLVSLLLFSTLFISTTAQSSIVSGTHVTVGGKTVNLQGLEWLTLEVTKGISRSAIEGGYSGLFAAGWRYATRLETAGLLGSLWGGTYSGGSVDNGDGADWFFRTLGGGSLTFGHSDLRNYFYGAEGECSLDPALSCQGYSRVAYSNVGLPPTGWFYTEQGLDATIANPATVSKTLQDSTFGNLLVRGMAVPIPAAVWLFGSGLLGLLGVARCKRA